MKTKIVKLELARKLRNKRLRAETEAARKKIEAILNEDVQVSESMFAVLITIAFMLLLALGGFITFLIVVFTSN